MNQIYKTLYFLFFMCGLFALPANSQISYLGKTFHYQDGLYGLVGTRSICFSPDKKNIYVSSENSLAVFSYDTVIGETIFLKAYKDFNDGIRGLASGGGVVVSPDGKYVYVSSEGHNCVALFQRLDGTGLLKFEAVFYDNENGNDGLRGVHGMEITKNGEYMYFAAWNDSKISAYQRDTLTGSISHLQSILQYDPGGMPWPKPLKLSRDNRFVYVSSIFADAISVFEINQSTGLLDFVQKTDPISGLYHPEALEISYDDAFLYLVCKDALLIFERNIQSGTLAFIKIFHADDANISGLHGSYSLSVSPDDKSIYTISHEDTSFVTFSRDLSINEFQFTLTQPFLNPWLSNAQYSSTAMISDNHRVFGTSYWESGIHKANRDLSTGILSYESFIYDGQNAVIDGLYNPEHCCSDYGQKHVFVTTRYNGISIFSRNDTTGLLTYKNVVNNESLGTTSLRVAERSIVSLDDKYLYTVAGFDLEAVILIFEIDHENDHLIIRDSITVDQNGINELRSAKDLIMSPDMNHVYVVSYVYSGVLQFDYNPQNGALDFIAFYDYSDIGSNYDQIKISANGEYVFVSSNLSSSLLMLGRDSQSGQLIDLARYTNSLPGGVHVSGLTAMDISKDDKNLYAVYENNDVLVNFSIDSQNDTLHIIQIMDYDTHPISGLQQIDRINIRYDGTFVFTTSRANHSLGLFLRNQSDGKLTFINDFTEPEWDFDGLDGVSWIEIIPNDRNLYLVSDFEEGIASYKIDLYLGPDLSICEGDTVLLDAGQGYETYKWSTNETTRQIKVWEEGWYILETIDYFGFTDADSLYLTVNPLPELDLGADINSCIGDTIVLYAGTHYKVLWSTESIEDSIIVTSSGEYSVLVTTENHCSKQDTIDIMFHAVQVELGPDTTINPGQSISISVNHSPGNTYLWYNGSTDTIIVINSNSFYVDSLQIWVDVSNLYGCHSSDSVMIYLNPDIKPPVPKIEIMPVPTRHNVYIKSNYIIVEIECYDIYGNHIFTKTSNSEICHVNLETYARGAYFMKVKLNIGFTQVHRVIRL